MLRIGCHLSSSKGFKAMAETALSIGANTFQYFSRNPRGGSAKAVDPADIEAYKVFAAENDIKDILTHAPYTLNPCAADEGLREFAKNTMLDDLQRLELLDGGLYNFHPGSHVKQGIEVGTEYIAAMLNEVLWPQMRSTVLLETMAGKGSEIGRTFEELRDIIDKVELKDKLGVCLDTCHIWEGGYDIVNDLDGVIESFDKIIGLDRLKAIHLNDSKNPISAHKDRHEKIGDGSLGLEAIERIINHPSLRDKPFFLETPNELEGYAEEIELLKKLYH